MMQTTPPCARGFSALVPDIADLFAAEGALDRALSGYRTRDGQIEMARQVEETLLHGGQCVLEAGTGIGKTFAYLTPIIQSGMTALISTGARALQDQLSQKDIPLVADALGHSVSLAVLKGRANYICRKEISDATGELLPGERDDWQKIIQFAAVSDDGDLSGITEVSSDSRLLKRAVSTRESCDKQECKYHEECFLYRARARARKAEIVIVNHHLFLSDMRLKEEGVAELLPSRDVVLFDEAHLLPELAPQFFGEQVSGKQLLDIIKDLERVAKKFDGGNVLLAGGRELHERVGQWLEACHSTIDAGEKSTAAKMLKNEKWVETATMMLEALKHLSRLLQHNADKDTKIAALAGRVMTATKILEDWLAAATSPIEASAPAAPEPPAASDDPAAVGEEDDPIVCWVEQSKTSDNVTIHSAPMTGRNLFARQWEQIPTLFFTSATLSVGGDFRDFCENTGLTTAQTCSWDSPYDFANRSLLYLPPKLPDPTKEAVAHTQAVVDAALPLVCANGGRAFMLFSSWRALREAYDLLQEPLEAEGISILKQGDKPNVELLRRFRKQQRVVLVGSKSFWQGVDVRGDALSLLVVDKIPFTPPTDPLLMARDEWREARGESAFMRNQLPAAVLMMKQVAGRLIRDYDDYGVFMIGDPRITTKSYGKTVLSALPPMPPCTDGAQAAAFLQRFDGG